MYVTNVLLNCFLVNIGLFYLREMHWDMLRVNVKCQEFYIRNDYLNVFLVMSVCVCFARISENRWQPI